KVEITIGSHMISKEIYDKPRIELGTFEIIVSSKLCLHRMHNKLQVPLEQKVTVVVTRMEVTNSNMISSRHNYYMHQAFRIS
ncbi:hypothetical protein L9F63_002176, partial [Diploptera punctata]